MELYFRGRRLYLFEADDPTTDDEDDDIVVDDSSDDNNTQNDTLSEEATGQDDNTENDNQPDVDDSEKNEQGENININPSPVNMSHNFDVLTKSAIAKNTNIALLVDDIWEHNFTEDAVLNDASYDFASSISAAVQSATQVNKIVYNITSQK